MGVEGTVIEIQRKNETISTTNRSNSFSSDLKAREHNELGEDDNELSHKSNDDLIGLLENLKLDVPPETQSPTEEPILYVRGKVQKNFRHPERDYLYGVKPVKPVSAYQTWDYGRVHSVNLLNNNSIQKSFASRSLPATSQKVPPEFYVEGRNYSCQVWTDKHRRGKRTMVTDGPVNKHSGMHIFDDPDGLINRKEMTLPFMNFLMSDDIDTDSGPAVNVLDKCWEEGIPPLDTHSDKIGTLENFDNQMNGGIFVSSESHDKLDKYELCSPPNFFESTVSMYTPSPERRDEVLLISHDRFTPTSSPESMVQEENDLDLVGPCVSPKQPVNAIKTAEPSETWNISDDCFISQPTPPKQQPLDWIGRDMDGDSILHSCVIAGVPSCEFEMLLTALDDADILGDIINHQNECLRTSLFLAVLEKKLDIVTLLLNRGADPNIQGKVYGIQDNYELRSPLHLVAEMGDEAIQILQILLDNKDTTLDIRSESDRRTPLHLALLSHQLPADRRQNKNCSQTIATLLTYGANPDISEDTSSKTPIMMVIDTHDFTLMKTFMDCMNDQEEVRTLLEATTRGGDTPLHIAAGSSLPRENKIRLIRLLVSRGANTNVENNIKQQPEDIASRDLWKEIFRGTKSTT